MVVIPERPNLLVAATVAEAAKIRREFYFSSWHVMTPRNNAERGWVYGKYTWTPQAQKLPARVRWELRQRLAASIDEESEEKAFPTRVLAW